MSFLIVPFVVFSAWTFAAPLTVTQGQTGSIAIFSPGPKVDIAFLWASIGLAVMTAFLQGLVTALASMTESSNQWTFRFRLAKIEHLWWTMISTLLSISLILIFLSFATGNNNEAISILALATTTLLTIVRYLLPSWRSHRYVRNRYFAWTGPSRTAIDRDLAAYCRSREDWVALRQRASLGQRKRFPSDYYGWHILPVKGIQEDPTDILKNLSAQTTTNSSGETEFIYADGDRTSNTVSLYWGKHNGFLPRVSRSISAVPHGLLKSQPFTNDGYAGEGFCLGIGILGRNKGLRPKNIVFMMTSDISTYMENKSTWKPRPSKTLRSIYRGVLESMYHGIGPDFVAAAVELCLLLTDASEHAIEQWLRNTCEHQSYDINKKLQDADASQDQLRAHYESSYVSMIMSLNNMKDERLGHFNQENSQAVRPDLICMALLLKARGHSEPHWWKNENFQHEIMLERKHLDTDFYTPAAQLLGLDSFPAGLEEGLWNGKG